MTQRYLRWGFWPRYGKFMVRVRGRFYAINAPWNLPLFSERYRLGVRVIPLCFGWRIVVRSITPPVDQIPPAHAAKEAV